MNIVERITKTASEKISNVKEGMWEKIEDVNMGLANQAQYNFVNAVAKDEGVDYETALEFCTPHTPKWQPKYSLGYKMQAPYVTVMLATDKGKQAFKRDLLPEELQLFEDEVEKENMGSLLSKEFIKQKKQKRKKKKEERNRSFGLVNRKKK